MLLFCFLVCAAFIAMVYVGFPALVWLLSRVHPRCSWPAEGPSPSAIMVIPAHNEERVIAAKLANFLQLDYPASLLTAVVISDGSTDRTCEVVRDLIAGLPLEQRDRVRLIERTRRSGKTAAISDEVPKLDAEVLIFTDANAFYRPDAAQRLTAPFRNPAIGLVCGRLRYVPDRSSFMTDEELYWEYEDNVKRWEGRMGRLLVANGGIYAVRAELFEPIPGSVADDLATPLLVAHAGRALVYEPEAIAEEQLPAQGVENLRAKARITTRGFTGLWHYRRQIVASGPARTLQYFFRKLGRWWVGLALAAMFVSSGIGATNPLLAVAFTGQVAFYSLAVGAWILARRGPVPGVLRLPFYFLLVNVAATMGFFGFLRGARRSIWEKSESTRREVDFDAAESDRWFSANALVRAILIVGLVIFALAGAEGGAWLTYSIRNQIRDWRDATPSRLAALRPYEVSDPRFPGNWLLRPGSSWTREEATRYLERRGANSQSRSLLARATELGIASDQTIFEVNGRGFRGPPLRENPSHRVLVLGDSQGFGSLLEASTLARVSEAVARRRGLDLEVVNASVQGYHPRNFLVRHAEWRELEPDVVVLLLGSNAIYGERLAVSPGRRSYTMRALSAVAHRVRYQPRSLEEAREELLRRPRVPDPLDPALDRVRNYEASFFGDLRELGALLKASGARVVIATVPGLYRIDRLPSEAELEIGLLPGFTNNPLVVARMRYRYNEDLRFLAIREGFAIADVSRFVADTMQPAESFFLDSWNLTDDGQARAGGFLAERLIEILGDESRKGS